MEYKNLNGEIYLRVDPNEELLTSITKTCRQEKIFGGCFIGIGACSEITLSAFVPAENDFVIKNFAGMFEIVSLTGNITNDALHAHAMFSYLDENKNLQCIGGHLRRALINYTAEIIIRPANSVISHRFDIVPNVGVWKFDNEKI
ncbi:MAG: DNA-binding protein [Selenomonadaceae bacterium]|nr:DNA-binding protein [Selenomonadaceae bacterium]